MKNRARSATPVPSVCVWAAVEFLVLAAAVVSRTVMWTYGADTGTFAQLIGSSTLRDALEGGSHFRFHWSPTLELLWPLVALTHSAITLQLLQAAAVAATPVLLILVLRPYLGASLADRVGVVALLYPPLVSLGFGEFHELGLFPPLALAMLLAADRCRWGWLCIFAALALGLREDVCIELAVVGVVFAVAGIRGRTDQRGLLFWSPKQPRRLAIAGIATACASCAALVVYYDLIVPRFGGWGPQHFYAYDFARGPAAVALGAVVHPFAFARAVLTFGRLTYVLEALAPLAFLPLFSRWSLLAIPGAAIVLLANSGYVWRMGDHYAALWIPWLLVGAGLALRGVAQRNERRARTWVASAAALCCVVLIAFDPMHPLHYLHPAYARLPDARRAFSCVPSDATLATHDEWYAATAVRFPNETVRVAFGPEYLVYAADYPNDEFQQRLRPQIEREVRDGRYRLICRYGSVNVYRQTRRRNS